MKKLYYQKRQVNAMKKLLKNYKSTDGILPSCPLCKAISIKCQDCVWMVETGEKCNAAMIHYGLSYDLRNKDNPIWTQRRIKELKKWIKKYDIKETK